MGKDEALKLALEALEAVHIQGDVECVVTPNGTIYLRPAIADIKEALTQLKQEPWCMKMNGCKIKCEDCPDKLAQPEERNFCPRCGKRTADLTTIHTCTPPIATDPKAFHGFPHGPVSTPNAGGKCVTAGETAPTDVTQKAESLRGQ